MDTSAESRGSGGTNFGGDLGMSRSGNLSGLVPQPYRTVGETSPWPMPIYEIPIHFMRQRQSGNDMLCYWSNKDAMPASMNNCPIHGQVPIVCEFNPDHTKTALMAIEYARIPGAALPTPVCGDCSVIASKLTGGITT